MEDTLARIRYTLERHYGVGLFSQDYIFAARVPRLNISDFNKEDLDGIVGHMKYISMAEIKEKASSILVLADEDHIELEVDEFGDVIIDNDSGRIRSKAKNIGRQSDVDPRIGEILLSISEKESKQMEKMRFASKSQQDKSQSGRGRMITYREAGEVIKDVAILPTVRSAAMRSGKDFRPGYNRLAIKRQDIQEKIRKTRTPTLVTIVFDASGAEDEGLKERRVRGATMAILKASYEKRYQVSLISYSGIKGKVVLNYTTDVDSAANTIRRVTFGDLTPLASGIMTGVNHIVKKVQVKSTSIVKLLIVITDGRANVPLIHGGHIRKELAGIGKLIQRLMIKTMIIDISMKGSLISREVAVQCGAKYYHLPAPLMMKKDDRFQKFVMGKAFLESVEKKDKEGAMLFGKAFLKEKDELDRE